MRILSFCSRMASVALCAAVAFTSLAAAAADHPLSSGGDIAAELAKETTVDGDTITLGEGTYLVNGLAVNKGVTIRAAEGVEATLDLQSKAGGIVLSADGAIVKGCKLVNCRSKAVLLSAAGAKLLDCFCTGLNETSGTGTYTFRMTAGEIRGCTFSGFTGGYAYKNYLIEMTGGTFADSLIVDAKKQFDWMVYVNGSSAVVTNLVVRNSPGKGTSGDDNLANGVLYLGSGLVTHSVITNSGSVGAAKSGTVLVAGGTLRNSLVADCKSPKYPGVYMSSGRMENCTIANNTTKAASVNGYSLNMSGGTAVNNVFSDAANNAKSVVVSGGTFVTNLIPVEISRGVGNKVGIPYFVNPANGNYAPGLLSPAVDAADRLAWITPSSIDLVQEPRVKGAGPDMGAFEGPYGVNDPLSCGFSVANNMFRADAADKTVSFSARVAGLGSEGATCAWYLDDATEPVGTGLTLETDKLPPGLHSVKLVVTPAVQGIDPLEYTQANCVFIYPKTLYVDETNTKPESPYDTPAKAATTLKAAVDLLETSSPLLPDYAAGEDAVATVVVADGTYKLNDTIFRSPVRLVAKTGAAPKLDIGEVNPGLSFPDGRQLLDGFTVINGRTSTLRLYAGTCLRNCTFENLVNTIDGTSSPFIQVSGATVSNCVFNGAKSTQHTYADPVLSLTGAARVDGCLFENITKLDSIVWVSGETAVMSNCVFRNCPLDYQGGYNPRYNVLYLTSGLVTHCVITNCGSLSSGTGDKAVGGIVAVEGSKAILRNCLIAGCTAKVNAGIDIASGAVENCTVVGGTLSQTASGAQRNLRQTGGRVVNSIFWNTTGIDGATLSGGTFEYSSSVSEKAGGTNRFGDPNLDAAFVPKAKSFARDNGYTDLDWILAGTIDLRGSNRVVNAKVDIGAMEGDELPPELALMLSYEFSHLDGDKIVYAVTPTAQVGYDPVVDPQYAWTVDGEAAGESTGVKEFALAPRVAAYSIGCTLMASGQTKTEYLSISVHNGVFYVSPDGSNEPPYDSWEKAANTLDMVLAIPHPTADTRTYTVHLSSGKHSTCGFNLTSAVRILGEDGAIFNAGGAPVLNHTGCCVSNVVFSGRGFTMNNGLMRDVVVRNLQNQSGGTLITIAGGTCDGFVFSNCVTSAWNYQYGINVSGSARFSNFLIDTVSGYDKALLVGGSAVVSNGVLNNVGKTDFKGYEARDELSQYALYQSGGMVSHLVVTNCGAHVPASRRGLVNVGGGTLRNSLIAHNKSTDCAGVRIWGGSLENCTVVVDEGASLHKTGFVKSGSSTLEMTGGFATNCVFYSAESAVDGKYYCRVDGGKIGNCWLSVKGADPTPGGKVILTGDNPGFKTVGAWDWVPAGGSPLVGKGLNQGWMEGATDLSGKTRRCGRKVDIGAFEGDAPGLMLLVR